MSGECDKCGEHCLECKCIIKSGGIYCGICKCCISPARKRKKFKPDTFIKCYICSIEDPFRRCISKMNKELSQKERTAFNKFRLALWNIADQIRDLTRSPRFDGDWRGKLGEDLMDKICEIPVLYK